MTTARGPLSAPGSPRAAVLRRAGADDLPFLLALAGHAEVAPHLAVGSGEPEALRASLERSAAEPNLHGRFVVEREGAALGAAAFTVVNRRSRIAEVTGVMVAPAARGRGIAGEAVAALVRLLLDDLGMHRVQLEVYGHNEAAVRVFERVGFQVEGRRRGAYWRHGRWNDGILLGRLADDPR